MRKLDVISSKLCRFSAGLWSAEFQNSSKWVERSSFAYAWNILTFHLQSPCLSSGGLWVGDCWSQNPTSFQNMPSGRDRFDQVQWDHFSLPFAHNFLTHRIACVANHPRSTWYPICDELVPKQKKQLQSDVCVCQATSIGRIKGRSFEVLPWRDGIGSRSSEAVRGQSIPWHFCIEPKQKRWSRLNASGRGMFQQGGFTFFPTLYYFLEMQASTCVLLAKVGKLAGKPDASSEHLPSITFFEYFCLPMMHVHTHTPHKLNFGLNALFAMRPSNLEFKTCAWTATFYQFHTRTNWRMSASCCPFLNYVKFN